MRDTDLPYGVGVLVARDGRFLCGRRSDTGEIGSPGGHIARGEIPEQAAIRETQEEFGITPRKLRRVGCLKSPDGLYLPTMVFICTDYEGTPACGDAEMSDPEFMDVRDLDQLDKVYPAFDDSINLLIDRITHNDGWVTIKGQHVQINEAGEVVSGNPRVMGGGSGSDAMFRKPRRLNDKDWRKINSLIDTAESNGVEYREVHRLDEPLTEKEIIAKVGRIDPTGASCVSVALAYVGNKLGLDVEDFRGGDSLYVFCQDKNTRKLYDVGGCKRRTFIKLTETRAANAALKTMQEGKEYILHVGSHASVVRLHHNKMQYLGLQKSAAHNGWHSLSSQRLERRFQLDQGERESILVGAIIVDISTLNHEGLPEVLGYINTAD